jgi:Sec7-like guanine-nucleotide exchange factor
MNQLMFKEAVALLSQYDLAGDLAVMLKDALNLKQLSLRAAGEFLTHKYGNFKEISLIFREYNSVIDGFIEFFDFNKMELSEALR